MRAAVLGTGIMGAGMARSLAREGHDVVVWNRTRARAQEVAGDRVAAAAGDAAGRLVDGPVLGTRKPAEDGTLVVLASGPASARSAAAPALGAIGSRTVDVGDELGAASALKLVCNAFVATLNSGIAQSYTFASALGLDPSLFLETIRGGAMDAPYVAAKAGVIAARAWDEPSFAVDGVRKDVGLMREAARAHGFPEDLLAVLANLYDRAAADGLGGADMAAVAAVFGEGR